MRGVIMLVNQFPPVPAGGAERQAERLAAYLAGAGVSVGVITRSAAGLQRHERRDGYWIERVPQPGVGKLRTVTFMILAALSLFQRRHTYDILHAHLAFSPALVAGLVARLLGKRVIVKYGTSGAYGDVAVSQRKIRGRVRLALLRRWTHVSIALDEDMERELLEAGFPRSGVVRMDNGIDASAFLNLSPEGVSLQGLEGRIVALYTGRLVAQKALPTLLQALRDATRACPKLVLVLLGQGPERAALEEQVLALGLTEHVIFGGNVPDVRPYLAVADMFVLPSAGEGISNALLEAMAAGLPCIATAVGGSPEVLDQGACGILVAPGDREQLAAALLRLAQDSDERARLGLAARERIDRRYSFAVTGELYRHMYQQLVTSQPQLLAPKSSKEVH